MSIRSGTGVVLVTAPRSGAVPQRALDAIASTCDAPPATVNGVWVGTWGLETATPTPKSPVLLTSTNLTDSGSVASEQVARWLFEGDLRCLGRMLPPFGAVGLTPDGLRLTTDQMAFRNVFRCEGDGWSAVSTSALLLARMLGRGLDPAGLRLQSQLGWQLGTLTLFEGVRALAPRESVVLDADGIHSEWIPHPEDRGVLSLDESVELTAEALRDLVTTYLEEGHEPTLQLTGGQDSRIVLSSVPKERRRGLRVMTLAVPGSPDARIAAQMADRFGMRHTVRSLDTLAAPTPEEWFRRTLDAAAAHECMADPIARSVTGWAEESFEQGHRLSGLGGELARGFYYLGAVRPSPVTRRRAEQLARWRMLANDAVATEALGVHLRDAHEVAVDLVHSALLAAGPEWFNATDELYLHRIRRWGGLGEGAVAFRRTLVNPMLDHRFIEAVQRVTPAGKKGSRFLGRLQMALDEELAGLALDDRPPPKAYGEPGPLNLLRTRATRVHKLARKVHQRLSGTRRPPAGAAVVSGALTRHFRENPAALAPARDSGVFAEQWLDDVARGEESVSAANLALLVNVITARREGVV